MELLTRKEIAQKLGLTTKAVENQFYRKGIKPIQTVEKKTVSGLVYSVALYEESVVEYLVVRKKGTPKNLEE